MWIDPDCGRIVARIVGNEMTALDVAARKIMAQAQTLAASHNITGEFASSFSVIRTPGEGGVTDRAVINDHPWAASIEFGHIDSKSKRPVAGLHILRRAAR